MYVYRFRFVYYTDSNRFSETCPFFFQIRLWDLARDKRNLAQEAMDLVITVPSPPKAHGPFALQAAVASSTPSHQVRY